jgi:ElaB/YqjD/DUF883 family membrane-anchored ribosome-binding protein
METREENVVRNATAARARFDASTREAADAAARTVEETTEDLKARVTEKVGRAKDAITDAYEKSSDVATRAYSRAMDYSRENPRTATLVALGAGIGVGMLMGAMGSSGRTRGYRKMFPSMALAVADAVLDVFEHRR